MLVKSSLHIALVISSLTSSGGAERALSCLANYWVSKGHQISLITLTPESSCSFYFLDPKIKVIHLNQMQESSFLWMRLKNILQRIFCMRRTIQRLKPEVIVSFVDVTNITTLLATWGLKVPVVVSERTHPEFHSLPKLYRTLREWLYPRAVCVVTQTQGAADYFKKLKNVCVIPNAVSKPLQVKEKTEFLPSPKSIVSVGRLCLFKGFDTLIFAFSNLLRSFPDLVLTIYGEGQERGNLESLIVSLDLQNKVFLPGVTQNIQEILRKADLFIFPSHYEGFPNALCEAMAMGLPIIASKCSGNVDIVQDGIDGRFFPVGDAAALTKIALELLKDSSQRASLGAKAQEVSARFSKEESFALWDKILAQISQK